MTEVGLKHLAVGSLASSTHGSGAAAVAGVVHWQGLQHRQHHLHYRVGGQDGGRRPAAAESPGPSCRRRSPDDKKISSKTVQPLGNNFFPQLSLLSLVGFFYTEKTRNSGGPETK